MKDKLLRSKKMCASQKYTTGILKVTFFSINTTVKYIYYIEENLIRNIKIYYFYFIINIKITGSFLEEFLNTKMYDILAKKQVNVRHLFVVRDL
jgi:hypothetical protein